MRTAIVLILLIVSGCSAPVESVESRLNTLEQLHQREIDSWKTYWDMRRGYEYDLLPTISIEGQEAIKANNWDALKDRDKRLWEQYCDALKGETEHKEKAQILWDKILPLRQELGLELK